MNSLPATGNNDLRLLTSVALAKRILLIAILIIQQSAVQSIMHRDKFHFLLKAFLNPDNNKNHYFSFIMTLFKIFFFFVTDECRACILARVEKERIESLTYDKATIYINCIDEGEETEVRRYTQYYLFI